ncbi:MAG: gamma-glutamyltransferase, partial [Byssovorax sp.]
MAPPPSASAGGAEPASAEPSASAAAAPSYPPPAAPDPPIALHPGGKSAVRGEAGLVTSVEPNATQAGIEVLRKGGNAVDAAVAVAFALAVTHPSAGNIGGGGFMIVRSPNGAATTFDYREKAPQK